LLTSIITTHADFIRRISHPEPGLPQRQYYKNLIVEFNEQVSEIIDQIGNLN